MRGSLLQAVGSDGTIAWSAAVPFPATSQLLVTSWGDVIVTGESRIASVNAGGVVFTLDVGMTGLVSEAPGQRLVLSDTKAGRALIVSADGHLVMDRRVDGLRSNVVASANLAYFVRLKDGKHELLSVLQKSQD